MLGATMIPGSADPKSSQAQPSWVVGPSIPAASRLGQVIEGEFLIKGVLGQGELGVTYEAENSRLKRKFAVLMLKRELKPTHEMMLAVRNDLRRAQQLGAAGLMPVKMLADRDGIPGFATELLEGETLRARLNRGPLRAERALAIVVSIARTLDAAHKVGLVHGDLRPENIFLVRPSAKNAAAGKVMVVEHAMHHLRRRAAGLDDRLPLYKHLYRPPEQVAGMIGATEKGDVFVLGAILHECLTARPAFFAEEIEFILENLASPPPPLQGNPTIGLSPELAEALTLLIRHACALQLDERVPSMSELIEGLEQIVQGYKLKLPEPPVETKDEVTAVARPATAASENMSRLLQRMSGVFPQIALPPTGTPVVPAAETAAPVSAEASQSGPSAAVRISGDAAASLPRLEPLQQERVSRILRKLSGAFPVIAPPPADAPVPGSSPESGQNPNVSASAAPASAQDVVVAAPTASARAPAEPVPAPSAVTPVLALAGSALVEPASRPAPLPAAPETVPTDPKAALPLLADLAAPQAPARPASAETAPPAEAAHAKPAPMESAAAAPVPVAALSTSVPATPTSAAEPASSLVPAQVPSLGLPPSSASPVRLPPAPTAAVSPEPASARSGKTAIDAAAERQQPTTAPIVPPPPAELEPLPSSVPSPTASPPLPPTLVAATPALALDAGGALSPTSASGPAEVPTRPRLEVSTELAVPHLALGTSPALLPAPVVLLPPAAVSASGPVAVQAANSPFQSGAIPAVPAALSSAPTAVQIQRPARLQHETTLAGDDLAVILEPSLPAMPVPPPMPAVAPVVVPPTPKPQDAPSLSPLDSAESGRPAEADLGAMRTVAQLSAVTNPSPEASSKPAADAGPTASSGGPRTVSDLSTRPALAALAEKLAPLPAPPRINELPTQPAVRRLPITELATQARIPSAGGSTGDGIDPVSSSLLEDAPPSIPPLALAGSGPTASPAAATLGSSAQPAAVAPVAAPAAAASAGAGFLGAASTRSPSRPIPAAEIAAPASAVTAPERAPAPRPPRVSQLIAALQNQQGPLRPVPEPEAVPAPVPVPTAPGPKATGAQARGLMPPAPDALTVLPPLDSQPLASMSQPAVYPVTTGPATAKPQTAVERAIDWALRHQELAAAGLGAVLVLLITLFYLALIR